MSVRDLIIIGAGPSGLSAAIAAKQRGLDYQVLEQGVLVNSIYRFPVSMVFFTTPELLEIGGLPFVSPYDKPTRVEALRYYRRVVEAYDLQISFDETALSIERENERGQPVFAIETRSSRGVRRVRHALNVLLAIGYYDHPVMLAIPGEDLPHVHHYCGEAHPYYRQRIVIVGGGNSAAEFALDAHRAGAFVTLVHRGSELKSTIKYWVRPDIENRIKEGSIAARFNTLLTQIRPTSVIVRRVSEAPQRRQPTLEAEAQPGRARESKESIARVADEEELPADAVFLLTGYRADTDLMCRAGIILTEREGPTLDAETFETNVPGLFVAGGAIAGVDTGTIFIENGRFHGEKIVEVIAGRLMGNLR
jgi:thioredoxin reductase (NADPH)